MRATNEGSSAGPSFTTLADTTAPTPMNIMVVQNGPAGEATMSWTTDEPATSLVTYGTTSNSYGSEIAATALVKEHSVPLTGLTGGTTYYYQVCSTDGADHQGCSVEASFPMDTTAPTPTGVAVAVDGPKLEATITWDDVGGRKLASGVWAG